MGRERVGETPPVVVVREPPPRRPPGGEPWLARILGSIAAVGVETVRFVRMLAEELFALAHTLIVAAVNLLTVALALLAWRWLLPDTMPSVLRAVADWILRVFF